jgi:hypothetical protein
MEPQNSRLKPVSAQSGNDDTAVELSSRRTGMSFQRTRIAMLTGSGPLG